MVKNRAALTTGTLTGWTYWCPYIALGIFAAGCVLAVVFYFWSKHRYEAVGRFVHEEA
jgi:hypothetical protein